MAQTPRAIVTAYLEEVWNDQQVDRVRTLCADPVVRHDARKSTSLSHEAQIARIAAQADRGLRFTNIVLHGGDEFVTAVWNMDGDGGAIAMSGIEVFKVSGGRIAEVWNSTYVEGHWG